MDKPLMIIHIVTYLLICTVCLVRSTCSGFPGLGHTYPVGDIILKYGTPEPLEITCVVTNETLIKIHPNISSLLYFRKKKGLYNYTEISHDKIIRLNETSIKLIEEHPDKMDSFYNCMLNNITVCFNNVVVGTPPQNVTDFKCIGYNYENLTCSWTPPTNYVSTNYSLSYTFPKTRSGSKPTDCNITDDKETRKKKCFWGLGTTPHYRQVQALYNFTLESQNRFGTLQQIFLFDHMKNILSEPPENLSCSSSTTSSLFLTWKVPHSIVPFPKGLVHRVLYQCNFGPKIWQYGGNTTTQQQETVHFNLTGLKHAHDVCDVRVAIRVVGSDSEDMWSAHASTTAYTSSTIPGAAPKVNIGSFQIERVTSLRDIYVYWQQIPNEIKNAEDFEYIVSVKPYAPEKKTTNSYAKYSNMATDVTYTFEISSNNSKGESLDKSIIVVPANDKMIIGDPVSFTKVAFDNGLYKLSWEKPRKGAKNVQNYTLFWCSNDRDRPFQCSGYLNWTEVPADTTEYNITVMDNQTTQFAISANGLTTSTGMVWATCTVMHNRRISQIKDVWITRVGSRFIELGWKLDCADRSDSVVAGYVIYYCRYGKDRDCTDPKSNLTINNAYTMMGIVQNLTPYTTYKLTVSVINKLGSQSLESEPLLNTTYEDVSTEPFDLEAIDVKNTSITLTWKAPKEVNGFLRTYEIYYNNTKIDTMSNKTTYTLNNLQSDAVYNISVAARTVLTSKGSSSLIVSTKIGHPGKIRKVFVNHDNNTPVLVWFTEEKRRLNLYEISIKYKSNGENITQPLMNTTEDSLALENCGENGKYSSFYYKIRAVNIDKEKRYEGPWSTEQEDSCELVEQSTLIWVVIAIGCVAFLATMFFSGKKFYIYIKGIRDIEIKLPQGLDPQIGNSWPEPKQPPRLSLGDEERLLHKIVPRSGDSSGCSSGQESVSSDSGSNITSTSDSGTEQPRTPRAGEDITDPLDKIDTNPPYVMAANLFSTPCDPILKETEEPCSINTSTYVPLNNIQEKNSPNPPYVMAANLVSTTSCDQMLKAEEPRSVNTSSYVPFGNIQEKSSSPNPPYVMAATKNAIMSSLVSTTPCDQMLKTGEEPRSVSTSTYVPLSNTQEKNNPNPPYVMAANKNVIMSNLYYPSVI